MATQITKKRKFVVDGVFYAELNEVLSRVLAEDGYSGAEVGVAPMRTESIIRATTRPQNVLGSAKNQGEGDAWLGPQGDNRTEDTVAALPDV